MDRNSLTALLTALAVVPLYFKEPYQSAPEKWERGSLRSVVDYEKGELSVRAGGVFVWSDAVFAIADRHPDDRWRLSCHSALDYDKNDLKNGVYTTLRPAEEWIGNMRAEAERLMVERGWQPFAVEQEGESHWLRKTTIHYRRRVQ